MVDKMDFSGMAALSLVESLLLALNDNDILREDEIMSVLEDAATAHEQAVELGDGKQMHEGVAALIRKIIAGGNSVRSR